MNEIGTQGNQYEIRQYYAMRGDIFLSSL